jgi:hypothetical protein
MEGSSRPRFSAPVIASPVGQSNLHHSEKIASLGEFTMSLSKRPPRNDVNEHRFRIQSVFISFWELAMPACLNCNRTEQEYPLIKLTYQAKEVFICPQCLPILIHKPYQLAEKIPDFKPSSSQQS